MRYAQGGGLNVERRASRERVRLGVGERFAAGEKTTVIAKELRVGERSVERWRRAWREEGLKGLRSSGPANAPRISEAQFTLLEEELGKGPAAHGIRGPAVDPGPGPGGHPSPAPRPHVDSDGVAAAETARLVLASSCPSCA
ncbi:MULTISPECIES: helix-turn-helix domain-containing protein [unclassified Streptomyces]|uniref:helix-turn-helix domain-containing protein n=1 Tax=unclassified Streptomyces TaxID=2593676 RepID=UPI003870C8BE